MGRKQRISLWAIKTPKQPAIRSRGTPRRSPQNPLRRGKRRDRRLLSLRNNRSVFSSVISIITAIIADIARIWKRQAHLDQSTVWRQTVNLDSQTPRLSERLIAKYD